MSIKVVVSGTGSMGRQVGAAVMEAEGMEAVAYLEAIDPPETCDGLPVYGSPVECFAATGADVVIDFTNAQWTPKVVDAAVTAGVRPVTGTSGLAAELVEGLAKSCADTSRGAVVASNFALGAVLMMNFAKQAAPFFDNVEIIELHHDRKVDAPSGTAKTTAELISAARETPMTRAATDFETIAGTRGGELDGVTIHSVRLPGLVAHQEVLFGGLGQTLTIRHDSTGRDSFMPGVVLAVRAVMEVDHLVHGLDELLGLS